MPEKTLGDFGDFENDWEKGFLPWGRGTEAPRRSKSISLSNLRGNERPMGIEMGHLEKSLKPPGEIPDFPKAAFVACPMSYAPCPMFQRTPRNSQAQAHVWVNPRRFS
jgi:hypothetical protein